MADTQFNYDTIVSLHNSSGVIQNKSTYTPYTRSKLLRLRDDIDTLGELVGQTGANWTANNYDWVEGNRHNLSAQKMLYLSYITDLRSACEDLYTTQSLGSPSWTIATASLEVLYKKGINASISSGGVLTDASRDFTDVTDNTDYCYVQNGTTTTPGRYLITSSTATTLTLSGYPAVAATAVEFIVPLSGQRSVYTDVRKKTLITDVQTAILAVADTSITYYVDAVNGNDTTGDGSRATPYQTIDKIITELKSTGVGNVFFEAGTYTTLQGNYLTGISNFTFVGSRLGDVIISVPFGTNFIAGSVTNFKGINLVFGDGTNQGNQFVTCTTPTLEKCVINCGGSTTKNGVWLVGTVTTMTVDHCVFIIDSANRTNSRGVYHQGSGTINITNSAFENVVTGMLTTSGTTINTDYCGFQNVDNKETGAGAFNETNTVSTTKTMFRDLTNYFIDDDSDYIDAADDSTDVGGFIDGPYNVLRAATDSITATDAAEMNLLEFATDSAALEDWATHDSTPQTVTMNVSVDMLLGGLFESSSAGVVTYQTTADLAAFIASMNAQSYNATYNGAALDVSWDNTTGAVHEVHVAVDDGIIDFTPVSWWNLNGTYPSATTTDTNGTRGYAIDCTKDTETDDEWGDWGSFSTISATGVNDQQWDITLKVRIKNVSTDQWSEIITVSRTYYFNDFDTTMYYCADNPRVVVDEYANHANYYAQAYHTGTAKYTRPDGVDWSADDRRLVYNPSVKAAIHIRTTDVGTPSTGTLNVAGVWIDRITGGFVTSPFLGYVPIYAGIYSNYGDFNASSAHCFATASTQAHDGGTASFVSPVIGAGKCRYMRNAFYLGSDCGTHSSNSFGLVALATGEVFQWPEAWTDRLFPVSFLDYRDPSDSPWTACHITHPGSHLAKNFLWLEEGTTNSGQGTGTESCWNWTDMEFWINSDFAGVGTPGYISWKEVHQAGASSWTTQW